MPKSSAVLLCAQCTKGYFKRKRRRKGPPTLLYVQKLDREVVPPPRSNAQSSCKLKHYTHANMRRVPPIKPSRAGLKRLLPKVWYIHTHDQRTSTYKGYRVEIFQEASEASLTLKLVKTRRYFYNWPKIIRKTLLQGLYYIQCTVYLILVVLLFFVFQPLSHQVNEALEIIFEKLLSR